MLIPVQKRLKPDFSFGFFLAEKAFAPFVGGRLLRVVSGAGVGRAGWVVVIHGAALLFLGIYSISGGARKIDCQSKRGRDNDR